VTSEGFEVGDEVEWTSQSGGHVKTKRGKVFEVVPPSNRPVTSYKSFGSPRRHVSYTVRVPGGKLYWPLVKGLRLARTAEQP
jgi:hypothetical protein